MFRGLVYSVRQAVLQMTRNKPMMWSSLFSITAMMLLLGLFLIIAVNMNLLTQSARDQFDVVEVYLLDTISQPELDYLMDDLHHQSCVDSVEYISKDDAMRIMKTRWGRYGYLLDGLSDNPLPASLQIMLKNPGKAAKLVSYLKKQIGVEDVSYRQDDINRIVKITGYIQIGAVVIILFLIVVSVVVVANTVKLTVLARGKAISIMKYIGATNWFVRGPFLIEGMILGMISALFSTLTIFCLYSALIRCYSENLLIMFSMQMAPADTLAACISVIFLVLGVSIGTLGSLISMRRFLNA